VNDGSEAPGVFYDVESEQPLKFHIQKDLREEIIQWLEDMITVSDHQLRRLYTSLSLSAPLTHFFVSFYCTAHPRNHAHFFQNNGGQVLHQVPLNGYVLIDPASERGQKLSRKWADDDKPDRHVVCWTFVPGSVTAGERLSADAMQGVAPLFVNKGLPVGFTLDDNLGPSLICKLRCDVVVSHFLLRSKT